MKKILLIICILFGLAIAAIAGMTYLEGVGEHDDTYATHGHDESGKHIEDEVVTAIDADIINYLGSYTILDAAHGTEVTVTVDEAAGTRTMVSNTLPNHDIGTFPNPGNPNTPSAQDRTNVFPLNSLKRVVDIC